MFDHPTAIHLIENTLPNLSDALHGEIIDGLLHMQIGEFSHYTQGVIDSGDAETWAVIVNLFIALWQNCQPDVKNALNVSFLENLHFNDDKNKRTWAYRAMPPEMKKAWDEMDAYNRKLHGN